MVIQPEDGPALICFVAPYTLKNPASVMQGISQNMDFGIIPVNKLTVEPDFIYLLHDKYYSISGFSLYFIFQEVVVK